MTLFKTYPTYSRYRTLWLTTPMMEGEDVYALQNGLLSCGFNPNGVDGILGIWTAAAIKSFQHSVAIEMDGKAGGDTQRSIALELASRVRRKLDLPSGALPGQIEHESGFRLGNYSAQRPDGSYDIGVTQRNSAHLEFIKIAYVVLDSIMLLGRTIHNYYVLFDGVKSDFRRWSLAQGAWNAPAFACYIANEEGATVDKSLTAHPSADSRWLFEGYMKSVTTHLNV